MLILKKQARLFHNTEGAGKRKNSHKKVRVCLLQANPYQYNYSIVLSDGIKQHPYRQHLV